MKIYPKHLSYRSYLRTIKKKYTNYYFFIGKKNEKLMMSIISCPTDWDVPEEDSFSNIDLSLHMPMF